MSEHPAQTLVRQVRNAVELEIMLLGPLAILERGEVINVPDTRNDSTMDVSTSTTSARDGDRARQQKPDDTDLFGPSAPTTADTFDALIPEGSPLHSFRSLAEVEAWTASTLLIPIDEVRLNPVFGVGDPEADLMVIGEAPGADEDRQGEPFVGRAGQLLNQILAAIGFDRREVYIANILKSRPPNNRDPLPAEVEAHIPILYKQIALIRPRLILCVGKTAGNALLGHSGSLKSLRGRFHDYHGIPVLVTYHPAALLRNPQWKRPTWEDVQMLRKRYDRLSGRNTGN